MQTHEIRKRFLDHFVKAGHTEVPSASVILDDPNLLFVNAGMVQFVPFFLGQRTPPYATAGVAIIETGAGSDDDLVDTLERLLPRDDRYRHAHGSEGHGADHVLPAIVAPSVTVPVIGGEPQLGTWQSIVLVDLNRDNPRRSVRLSFLDG